LEETNFFVIKRKESELSSKKKDSFKETNINKMKEVFIPVLSLCTGAETDLPFGGQN
jgi:hypothetical protein